MREWGHCRVVGQEPELDIGNCGGEGRKTLAPRDYVWNPWVLDIGNCGGERREMLALRDYVWNPEGYGYRKPLCECRKMLARWDYVWNPGCWISETSEVRVARLLHRRDYVWNPGIGYRKPRGRGSQDSYSAGITFGIRGRNGSATGRLSDLRPGRIVSRWDGAACLRSGWRVGFG